MKFHIWGDLHYEFENFKLPDEHPGDIDCILVPGDIWTKGRAVQKLELIAAWGRCPVVAIPGNHDYYGDRIGRTEERMRDAARKSPYEIKVLLTGTTVIAGTRIIGATLWTDYRLHQREGDLKQVKAGCERIQQEHQSVRMDLSFRKVTANDLEKIHVEHKEFLRTQMAKPFDGPTIIMTHHAPSAQSLLHRSEQRVDDAADASNLDDFVEELSPEMWIHSHTHHKEDYMLGSTRSLSNAKGYPHQKEETGFNALEVFDSEMMPGYRI